jgi:hypothetical protein
MPRSGLRLSVAWISWALHPPAVASRVRDRQRMGFDQRKTWKTCGFEMISSPNIGESFWFIRKYRQELSIWSANISNTYRFHQQVSAKMVVLWQTWVRPCELAKQGLVRLAPTMGSTPQNVQIAQKWDVSRPRELWNFRNCRSIFQQPRQVETIS